MTALDGRPRLVEKLVDIPVQRAGVRLLQALLVALLAVGGLLVLNILLPLGDALGKIVITLAVVLGAWGSALALPLFARLRALWPATFTLVVAIPLLALLILLATWIDVPEEPWARTTGVIGIAVLFSFMVAPSFGQLSKGRFVVGSGATLGILVVCAAVLMLTTGGVPFSARSLDSALRAALSLLIASLVPLLPIQRPLVLVLVWVAMLQFAAMQALDPWVDGAASGRLVMAGILLLFLLALAALVAALIPTSKAAVAEIPPRGKVG